MFGIGTTELMIFLIIVLIAIGPDKMPKFMRAIGRTAREVKKAGREFRDAVGIDEIMRDAPVAKVQPPSQPRVEYEGIGTQQEESKQARPSVPPPVSEEALEQASTDSANDASTKDEDKP